MKMGHAEWIIDIGWDKEEETYFVDLYSGPQTTLIWSLGDRTHQLPTLEAAQAELAYYLSARVLVRLMPGSMRVRLREAKEGRQGTPLQCVLLGILDVLYGWLDTGIRGMEHWWRVKTPATTCPQTTSLPGRQPWGNGLVSQAQQQTRQANRRVLQDLQHAGVTD